MPRDKAQMLQDLMNHGYAIYQDADGTWTVHNIRDASRVEASIPTQEEAIDVALGRISPKSTRYAVEAMFNDGLGPKFRTIGVVEGSTAEEASLLAKELGERHFDQKKFKWEVRIRPDSPDLPRWE